MKTKICTKCETPKDISEFPKQKKGKNGLCSWCKVCSNERTKEYCRKHPWKATLHDIKKRCNNPKATHYKYYGGRGIKCLISSEELKKLWFRDKAYLMKKPSIDREKNNGNYTYNNCKYIEMGENCAKDKRKPIIQYTKDGIFIREWSSATETSITLKIYRNSISQCCLGNYKTAGGFKWKFK